MRRDKVRSALAFCTAGHRWCRAHNIEHKLEEFAGGQAYCSPEEATVKFQQLVDDPDAITDSVGEDTRARKRCWVNPQNRVTKRRICYRPEMATQQQRLRRLIRQLLNEKDPPWVKES